MKTKQIITSVVVLIAAMFIMPKSFAQNGKEFYLNERNCMNIMVNSMDKMLIDGRPAFLSDLKDKVKAFMSTDPEDHPKPQLKRTIIDNLGSVYVSKGIVNVRLETKNTLMINDINSELNAAFNELRTEAAIKHFGKPFNKLNDIQKDAIRKAVPVRVIGVGLYKNYKAIVCTDDMEVDDIYIDNVLNETNKIEIVDDVVEVEDIEIVDDDYWDDMEDEEEDVYISTEENPEFPGGTTKLLEYIQQNITYPMAARESGVQGRVFIGFIVEKDGSVSNVQVLRGIGGGCDEEAVRLVKSFPKFKPGKNRGVPVRVSYTLPINFKLTDDKK